VRLVSFSSFFVNLGNTLLDTGLQVKCYLIQCVFVTTLLTPQRRKSKAAETASVVASLGEAQSDVVPGEPPKLQHMYGVDAWKRWVQWSKTQPDLEKPRFGCGSAH
jgi:hypothetical protein